MGNNASQALAVANPKGAVKNAVKGVNQQLGLGESEEAAAAKAKQKDLEGAANRKEQKLRQQERATEYKRKTVEREGRKAALKDKWTKSRQENSSK